MIIVENNRDHVINIKNITNINNIGIIELHKRFFFKAYETEKVDHQSIIHSGIPTPSRKHVPVIPHVPYQEHHKKNPPVSSVSSLMI